MAKKITLSVLALALILAAVFAYPTAKIKMRSMYGIGPDGKNIYFDSRAAGYLYKQDREMSKLGFSVGGKVIEADEDILPYSGAKMRIMKVTSTYESRENPVSHERTPYRRFIDSAESKMGRLPSVFYLLDRPVYNGGHESEQVNVTVETRFLLIEDKKSGSGKYSAYGSTEKCAETTTYSTYDAQGALISSSSVTKTTMSDHAEGDLGWLKSMAYSNYVAPYEIQGAFEKAK